MFKIFNVDYVEKQEFSTINEKQNAFLNFVCSSKDNQAIEKNLNI